VVFSRIYWDEPSVFGHYVYKEPKDEPGAVCVCAICGGGWLKASDAKLVLEVLNGNQVAFSELYDRYARLVRVICHDDTGNWNQAEDLAQEVFLRTYDKLGNLQNPERFGPWLISITRNVCREYRRGRLRDRHVLVGLELPEMFENEIEDKKGRLADLNEAMAKLGERERLALHVYYLQNKDVEQAQKILGVSRSGLYRLLEKARKKVEKHMNKP